MPPVTARRPKAVWIVTIWLGFSAVMDLLLLLFGVTGTIPLNPDQQKVITALGPVNFIGTVLDEALTGFAAIQLFKLRKSSVIACGLTFAFDLLLSVDELSRVHFDQMALAMNQPVLIEKAKMLLDLTLILALSSMHVTYAVMAYSPERHSFASIAMG